MASVPLTEADLSRWQGVIVLAHRGRVRVSVGEIEQGVTDLLEADRRMTDAGCQLSVLCDWLPFGAEALARVEGVERARGLADRELAQARAFGSPRRLGMALSARGLLEPGDRGLELLREAVATLEASRARLERARS